MLRVPQLKKLQQEEPYLYEALKKIVGAVNALSQRAGVDPSGTVAAPPTVSSLSVVAAAGIADIAITDPQGAASLNRPLFYFVEFAADPSFSTPTTVAFGPMRNYRWAIGNLSGYFRVRSQFIGSPLSAAVTFGSPPTLVSGGAASGPTLQPPSDPAPGGFGGFRRIPGGAIPL